MRFATEVPSPILLLSLRLAELSESVEMVNIPINGITNKDINIIPLND